jgi:hypothetical protein
VTERESKLRGTRELERELAFVVVVRSLGTEYPVREQEARLRGKRVARRRADGSAVVPACWGEDRSVKHS